MTKRPEQPEQDERDAQMMRVFHGVVRSGRYAGAPSLKDIAEMLNAKGIATRSLDHQERGKGVGASAGSTQRL
jgi:hypothetical protein